MAHVSTDPPALNTMYGDRVGVLWLGDEAFAYVEEQPGLTGCRPPTKPDELAPWIVPAIADAAAADVFSVQRNLSHYLEDFCRRPTTPAVRMLRAVNWAAIPLVWHPLFLLEAQQTHTLTECEQSQSRLLRSIGEEQADPEVLAEAAELLKRITTLSWDR